MDEREIRKYASLMEELDLTGLEITENGATLRLERPQAVAAYVPAGAVAPLSAVSPTSTGASAEDGILEIRSPMVGVFYTSPTEDADPFIKVGDRVKKGDVLCIIEAMKLMNEITAEQDGVIEEICVGNNQVVDFDHILFRLRRV